MNNKLLLENLRCIPDFPQKGINFRDVTTLFKNAECLKVMVDELYEIYKEKGITSIAFPLLGANNGGLDGKKVEELMISYLSQCDIPIEIYHYDPQAPDDLFEEFRLKWKKIPQEYKKKILRTSKRIETIDLAVNSESVRSMISLIEFPGIGIKTMESCFKIVMRSQSTVLPFNNDNV